MSEPGKLAGLALARHTLDRQTERRGDAAELAKLWSDHRARVLVLADGQAPFDEAAGELVYVRPDELDGEPSEWFLLGVDTDGVPYFAVTGSRCAGGAARPRLVDLREAGALLADRDAGAFVHAQALLNWHATHCFCARCGAPTQVGDGGHIRRCPSCGADHFPRTDPAIIVLVTDEHDRALLGRGAAWPEGRFSTLAGFVEPGEAIEDAVVREVHEETGVVVADPRYAGSQPWPFPSSLMLGFFARATSTAINVDQHEIAEARWFSRDQLRRAYEHGEIIRPSGVSIARRLIETWYGDII